MVDDILSKKRGVVLTKGWEAPFILTKQRFPSSPTSNSIIIVPVILIILSIYLITFIILSIFEDILITFDHIISFLGCFDYFFDEAAFPEQPNSIIIVPVTLIFLSIYLTTFIILSIFQDILITFIILSILLTTFDHIVDFRGNSVFARQNSCLLPSQDSLELDFPPEKNFRRRSLLIGNTKKEPLERSWNCWPDDKTSKKSTTNCDKKWGQSIL